MKIEKITVMLAMIAFVVAFAGSLITSGDGVSKEEAIEMAKPSNLVKEGIATFSFFKVGGAEYHDFSWVEQMKTGHTAEMYEKAPQGHDIWEVTWEFRLREDLFVGYTVIVIVDARTGTLIYETKGVGFG